MNNTKQTTIWGAGTTRTFRAILTAEELGIQYELLPIGPRTGETKTPEYTDINRKQKIPFMRDDLVGLSESVAICRYLIKRHGSTCGFYAPEGLKDCAKEDEWVSYLYGELDETSLYVMRRHGDLQEIYGEAPAAVSSSKAYAARHLQVVDSHLSSSTYVMGDHYGLADIILISCLDWAVFYGIDLPGILPEYHSRIAERPAYQRAFEINYGRPAGGPDGTTK